MNGAGIIDRLQPPVKPRPSSSVTSASDTDIVVQLLSRGVIDYLVKPFEIRVSKPLLKKPAR